MIETPTLKGADYVRTCDKLPIIPPPFTRSLQNDHWLPLRPVADQFRMDIIITSGPFNALCDLPSRLSR